MFLLAAAFHGILCILTFLIAVAPNEHLQLSNFLWTYLFPYIAPLELLVLNIVIGIVFSFIYKVWFAATDARIRFNNTVLLDINKFDDFEHGFIKFCFFTFMPLGIITLIVLMITRVSYNLYCTSSDRLYKFFYNKVKR